LEEKYNLICEVDSSALRPFIDEKYFLSNVHPNLDKSAFKGEEEVYWASDTISQKAAVYELIFSGPNSKHGIRCLA
jgi:hypothetical protein